ncbi:MAG TPA: hypothetical protein PK530_00790 [Anaerolineales bacterium]|nr:hypothetical protein [Anaerolineales bacterium]
MMKTWIDKRYTKRFLAWLAILTYLLLAFIILITVETLTREYPKWHWWMNTVPVNVFSDAFMPVVNFAISLFSIPLGFFTILPILSHELQWNKAQRLIEIICYVLSISFLWFGFWLTGFMADCQMLSLKSDGGPWGPCVNWAWFSRPVNTFAWHITLWIIWSIGLIRLWKAVKRRLLSSGEGTLLTLQVA